MVPLRCLGLRPKGRSKYHKCTTDVSCCASFEYLRCPEASMHEYHHDLTPPIKTKKSLGKWQIKTQKALKAVHLDLMPGPYIFKHKTLSFKAIYIIGSKTSLNWRIHEYDSEAGTGSIWNYSDSATGQGTTSLLLKPPPPPSCHLYFPSSINLTGLSVQLQANWPSFLPGQSITHLEAPRDHPTMISELFLKRLLEGTH